jgi:hypothetical protein
MRRAAWSLAVLIAFAAGVGLGHGVPSFKFVTPEQFAQILAAFSGSAWPLATVFMAFVFRRAIRRALIILAWRMRFFKVPGVETAFAPLSGPQTRSNVRRGSRIARAGRRVAADAVTMASLERRTIALLRVAEQLTALPNQVAEVSDDDDDDDDDGGEEDAGGED